MKTNDAIKTAKQTLAKAEKKLAIERIKQRRADTRNKIQWGGLVIKSEMNLYNKEVILGALIHAFNLIRDDDQHKAIFSAIGNNAFMEIKHDCP